MASTHATLTTTTSAHISQPTTTHSYDAHLHRTSFHSSHQQDNHQHHPSADPHPPPPGNQQHHPSYTHQGDHCTQSPHPPNHQPSAHPSPHPGTVVHTSSIHSTAPPSPVTTPPFHPNMPYYPYQHALSGVMHELHRPATFKGHSGISVRTFINNVENKILIDNIPRHLHDTECLRLAVARCDSEVTAVATFLEAFNHIPGENQTWEEFKKLLITRFGSDTTRPNLHYAKFLRMRPKSYSKTDVAEFLDLARIQLSKWASLDRNTILSQHCRSSDSAEETILWMAKENILAGLDDQTMERVDEKLQHCTWHTFPAAVEKYLKDKSPSIQPSFAATSTSSPSVPKSLNQRQSTYQQVEKRPPSSTNNADNHYNKTSEGTNRTPTSGHGYNYGQRPPPPSHRHNSTNNSSNNYNGYRQPRPRQNAQSYDQRPADDSTILPGCNRLPVYPNFQPHPNTCFRCLYRGHSSRFCTSDRPFCPWHNTYTHTMLDCKEFAPYTKRLMDSAPRTRSVFFTAPDPNREINQCAEAEAWYFGKMTS